MMSNNDNYESLEYAKLHKNNLYIKYALKHKGMYFKW